MTVGQNLMVFEYRDKPSLNRMKTKPKHTRIKDDDADDDEMKKQ